MLYSVENYGLKSERDIISIIDYVFACHDDGWLDVTPCDESGHPSRKYIGFSIHVTALFGRRALCVYGWDYFARDFCRHLDDAFSIGAVGNAAVVAYCDCNRVDSIGF